MRLWPVRSRSFLETDDEIWQAETWRWLLDRMGGLDDLKRSPLVVASRSFFPPTEATGEARVAHVFDSVKRHARMPEHECRLMAQPERPESRVAQFTHLKPIEGHLPLGTFRVDGNGALITYDPAMIDQPVKLVATLAHELAHYRLAVLGEMPPGGEPNLEFATDLATVYLGFGLFGANTAFQFEQHGDAFSQGWRWSRQGYLTEREWLFALAVFFHLRGEPVAVAKPHLTPTRYKDLRRAGGHVGRHPEFAALAR
ncbi:MAG TPA: hypothetical protein VGV37_29600 [Aliidongia sp.]|uniref:hypothetical protein n=1 Tax=Aliidongia sp. TaxID=1914230 RepID=UPI002DDD7A09|nr:hypothetical protein [Aliidongia sp.]HEV2678720.1 hypothetical protein [Aliidongia sp.]